MFSLIITIISIALVAALALATIYYGGTSFNKGSADAKASQLINEGQQINGAAAMARADVASGVLTTPPADVGDLAPNYLSQVPAGWSDTAVLSGANPHVLTSAALAADVCEKVNTKAGLTTDVDVTVASVYGCINKTGDTNLGKMFYKI